MTSSVKIRAAALGVVAMGTAVASPAGAVTATLLGTALDSCVLTVSLGGVMVTDAAGTTMRSDTGVGALGATLAVVAQGATPLLTFAVPTLTGPGGFSPDSVQYSYSVAGSGASRGFAATGDTASANLIDTVTIHGLVTSAAGFATGTYTESIEVTCG